MAGEVKKRYRLMYDSEADEYRVCMVGIEGMSGRLIYYYADRELGSYFYRNVTDKAIQDTQLFAKDYDKRHWL